MSPKHTLQSLNNDAGISVIMNLFLGDFSGIG